MLELRVLGTLALHSLDGGRPPAVVTQPKRVALLLYLALAEPAGPHSRESLMALLWPEADDESTRHSLRNTLYGLRQALGEGAIESRGEGYIGLDPAAVRCDAVELRGLLAAGRWKEALAAWGGDLAPGFHVSGAPQFERWLDEQRAALRRTVADAAWRRVDEMEAGREPGVGEAARRACAIDPANEAGARRLMRVLAATTGAASALRAYDDLVEYLRREYDTAPSAETRALAGQLGIPEPAPPPSPLPPGVQRPLAMAAGPVPTAAVPVPPAGRRLVFTREVLITAGILVAVGVSLVALQSPHAPSKSPVQSDGQPFRLGALQLPARYRADTSAYGSYLRGLSLRFQGKHGAALDTFVALVDRAPQYPPGLAGLAHSYGLAIYSGLTAPREGWPKAEQAARRAIALDSTSAPAYLILAGVEMAWRWDLPLAGTLIDRALALDPTDAEAHNVRAVWFRWQGALDSALAESQKSHEMDPMNATFGERVAKHLYFLRRYDEAEAMYRRNLRDYPRRGGYAGLASVYRAEGRTREALEVMRSGLERAGDTVAASRIPVAASDTEASRLLAAMGREKLRELAEGVRRGDLVTPGDWAGTYARLGDVDETIRWIDSMRVGRDPELLSVPIGPDFDFVRNDPRYRAWEAKLTWRRAVR